jgi:putative Mn2+ efflux pump MntP
VSPLQLLILGAVIGSNNLAAALALGALGQIKRRNRIVIVFGVFEFVVPLIGIAIGQTAASLIAESATWIGPTLLIGLGSLTVFAGLRLSTRRDEKLARRVTTWRGLVALALMLGIDNLIIGFSLGLGAIHALAAATTIAVFSIVFTWFGITVGGRLRRIWQNRAEIASGALLILLGILSGLGWL